jgi:hypothetical protein
MRDIPVRHEARDSRCIFKNHASFNESSWNWLLPMHNNGNLSTNKSISNFAISIGDENGGDLTGNGMHPRIIR